MMYGTLFMMAGAYTLSQNGHVRGDVLYGFFRRDAGRPRPRPAVPVLHPGVLALALGRLRLLSPVVAGERARSNSPTGPPIYPFKTVIPIAGVFLLLQGIVEIIRCVICLRTGEGPSRRRTSRSSRS